MTQSQRLLNYQSLFDTMEMHSVGEISKAALLIKKHMAVYSEIVSNTSVPWYFIGIIHYRESDCDFHTHLHNGDPLTAKTVHAPAGRPITGKPPFTWVESAHDAMFVDKKINSFDSWTLPEILYRFEMYNGFGYQRPSININSPYLWSFTNHYTSGKFVADGHYSADALDKQVGCAPLLRYLTDKTLGIV